MGVKSLDNFFQKHKVKVITSTREKRGKKIGLKTKMMKRKMKKMKTIISKIKEFIEKIIAKFKS